MRLSIMNFLKRILRMVIYKNIHLLKLRQLKDLIYNLKENAETMIRRCFMPRKVMFSFRNIFWQNIFLVVCVGFFSLILNIYLGFSTFSCLSVQSEPADITVQLTHDAEYGLVHLRVECPGWDLKAVTKITGDIPIEGEFIGKDVFEAWFLPKPVYVNGTKHEVPEDTYTIIRGKISDEAKSNFHVVIYQNAQLLSIYLGE